jgi:hypothetical protein
LQIVLKEICKPSEARARQLLETAKPIYYAISGMPSPENGGPERLIELALGASRNRVAQYRSRHEGLHQLVRQDQS